MSDIEKIETLVQNIIGIEKQSMQKRFAAADGKSEKLSTSKADTEVVNNILSLLGEGKKKESKKK